LHILYVTDGSEAALAGGHFLAALPLNPGCRVTLLTVLPEGGDGRGATLLGSARAILRHTQAALDTEIRWGDATDAILRTVQTQPTDLVVIGSRGVSGFTYLLLGSVSEEVVRHAPCPVLVARPLRAGLQAAVLGCDDSECSRHAAEWLERFPLPRGCALHTVTVQPRHGATVSAPHGALPSLPEKRAEHAALSPGRRASASVENGDPAQTLLRVAEQREADLIVVGSHGRSGIGRLLLGSVSENVLRHAPCSVLVVKSSRSARGVLP
jgi:nucleotide-binding universal stress UspA family protein